MKNSQVAKFRNLRYSTGCENFATWKFPSLKNALPAHCNTFKNQKLLEKQACKRENLKNGNKPNNKGHKKITKLSNKILVTSEILQKSLLNVWPGGFMEGQGGGFPPYLLSVALHMALAFGH